MLEVVFNVCCPRSNIPQHPDEQPRSEDKTFPLPCTDDPTMHWEEVLITFKGRKVKAQKLVKYKKKKVKEQPIYIPDLSDLDILELQQMGYHIVTIG